MARSQLIRSIAMLGLFLSVASLLVPSTFAESIKFQYCSKKAHYPVKFTGLDITPYPISRNKNTTFLISASTDTSISGGELVIDVSYYFISFPVSVRTETHDLCKKTSCPVNAGDFKIAHSQELPGYTPPGGYSLKMTLLDAKKKQLACINFDFSIAFVASEDEAIASS